MKLAGERVRTLPRERSVELPAGPRNARRGVPKFALIYLRGHEAREGCAGMDPRLHADPASGALGGALYVATKRARAAPT